MMSTAILILAALAPLADDAKAFQGKWPVTGMQMNGQKFPAAAFDGMTLLVDGEAYKQMRGGTALEEGKIKFFPDKTPKEVDMMITEGPNKGKTQLGIYKLEGDTATFCVVEPGLKTRPTDFTSDAGSNRMIVTVKKMK
jgi:uncharacterized protein (TIGR03067 family)